MRARSSPVNSAVCEFSKAVIAERGVTHGQINFIPVMIETEAHPHHAEGHAPDHLHITQETKPPRLRPSS